MWVELGVWLGFKARGLRWKFVNIKIPLEVNLNGELFGECYVKP